MTRRRVLTYGPRNCMSSGCNNLFKNIFRTEKIKRNLTGIKKGRPRREKDDKWGERATGSGGKWASYGYNLLNIILESHLEHFICEKKRRGNNHFVSLKCLTYFVIPKCRYIRAQTTMHKVLKMYIHPGYDVGMSWQGIEKSYLLHPG